MMRKMLLESVDFSNVFITKFTPCRSNVGHHSSSMVFNEINSALKQFLLPSNCQGIRILQFCSSSSGCPNPHFLLTLCIILRWLSVTFILKQPLGLQNNANIEFPINSKADIRSVNFHNLLLAGRLVLVSILAWASSLLLNLFTNKRRISLMNLRRLHFNFQCTL